MLRLVKPKSPPVQIEIVPHLESGTVTFVTPDATYIVDCKSLSAFMRKNFLTIHFSGITIPQTLRRTIEFLYNRILNLLEDLDQDRKESLFED